ncbi:MAG: DUF1737 domain-containing protein [Verrucomicrobiota bacterium]
MNPLYKLVQSDSAARLEDEVNLFLSDGWRLFGATQVLATTGPDGTFLTFYQALTK